MPNKFEGDAAEGAATAAWLKTQVAAVPAPASPQELAAAMLECTIAGDAGGLAALQAMAGRTGGETRDDTPKEPTDDAD